LCSVLHRIIFSLLLLPLLSCVLYWLLLLLLLLRPTQLHLLFLQHTPDTSILLLLLTCTCSNSCCTRLCSYGLDCHLLHLLGCCSSCCRRSRCTGRTYTC
jgi:hypothetical protein